MNVDRKTFAERLAKAISESGFSQAELARRARVKRQTVNAWLKGRSAGIEGENLINVASALNVNSEWLRTGRAPPPLPAIAIANPPGDLAELISAWECLVAKQRAEFLEAITTLAASNRAMVEELSGKIEVRDTQMADDYIEALTRRPVTSPSDKEVEQKLFRRRRTKHA